MLQVPGLRKSSSVGSRIVTKLKPLIPAKVSGLSKKLSPVQKRNHCDAENKLGLQATIGELWRNFQFKRITEMVEIAFSQTVSHSEIGHKTYIITFALDLLVDEKVAG
ncbi:exonuclease 1-like isoform X2 [Meleagris gallopavo]|uniref:exonuclease 1-like isoform X2 n=1 Tax=Meleagris gallopavo TaxID=9103 RepID=UPI0009396BD9|nr:exonuclease 1-like isoform X2 [Meleagris gallopavo]